MSFFPLSSQTVVFVRISAIELNKKTGTISSLFSLASERVQNGDYVRSHCTYTRTSGDLSRTEPHDRTRNFAKLTVERD